MVSTWKVRGSVILSHWKFFTTLVIPILFCPLLVIHDTMEVDGEVIPSTKFRCVYVLLLMFSYWILDTLPLAVTSLLPLFLFPLLGVEGSADVAKNYMTDATVLLLGGLIIALAIECSNLHKRIALSIIILAGGSPGRVLLGTMLMTAFLSMWMSNTATTGLMIPLARATMESIKKTTDGGGDDPIEITSIQASNTANFLAEGTTADDANTDSRVDIEQCDNRTTTDDVLPASKDGNDSRNFNHLLAISYAASIGGNGMIVGTGSNLVCYELMKSANISQGGKYTELNFTTWAASTMPATVLSVLIAWAYLYTVSYGVPVKLTSWRQGRSRKAGGRAINDEPMGYDVTQRIRAELERLGPMSFHESAVTVLFIAAVIFWIFRNPRFISGWSSILGDAVDVRDSAPAILIVFLFFVIPRDPAFLVGKIPKKTGALLDWKYLQKNLSWGVIFLMGGGFAISDACVKSHLSEWIGDHLTALRHFPNQVILISVMMITSFLTEFIAYGCTNVVLPILMSLSERLNLHPLYLTFPATVCTSFTFMLPVSAPANAIAYAAAGEEANVLDMMKLGFFIKMICVAVFFAVYVTCGNLIFSFGDYQYPRAWPDLESYI